MTTQELFTIEEKRYIMEQYETDSDIKRLSEELGVQEHFITAAVKSEWYKEMKSDFDEFMSQINTTSIRDSRFY